MQGSVLCPRCNHALPPEILNNVEIQRCPACRSDVLAVAFPAVDRPLQARAGDAVMEAGEASCFYHPGKQAVTSCANCGRFLCALCDIEMAGEHLCTRCIEAGKKKGKLKKLENRRVLYDDLALSLAILSPFFCLWLGAPAALYIALRYWNSPGSVLPRTKLRYVVAIVLSVIEIAAGILFFYMLFFRD